MLLWWVTLTCAHKLVDLILFHSNSGHNYTNTNNNDNYNNDNDNNNVQQQQQQQQTITVTIQCCTKNDTCSFSFRTNRNNSSELLNVTCVQTRSYCLVQWQYNYTTNYFVDRSSFLNFTLNSNENSINVNGLKIDTPVLSGVFILHT